MDIREQEIWKRCMNGLQLKKKIKSTIFFTVKFKGEFKYNSPIYHVYFFGRHYIHQKDHMGWVIDSAIKFTQREEKDNDPRFPKFFWYPFFRPKKADKIMNLFFSQIQQKLKPCTKPSDKIVEFLSKNIALPKEIIWIICSNLLLVELEWLDQNIS